MRLGRVAAVVLAISTILAGEWLWLRAERERPAGEAVLTLAAQAAVPGGPFTLIDHSGQPVSERSFRGKYLVMVFGYSFCPDVCPTTLNSVAEAMALLDAKALAVQPLFVTVDPERDTPEVLADYVAAFDPRLVGLTGSRAQIDQMTRDYRVYAAKVETGDGDYMMDHSAYIYVIGPDGGMLTYLKHDATPEVMAETIERAMTQQASAKVSWN